MGMGMGMARYGYGMQRVMVGNMVGFRVFRVQGLGCGGWVRAGGP